MTCEPYCEICGGNLGHPANGDWTCSKCKSINEQLAPRHDRFCRCRDCKPPLSWPESIGAKRMSLNAPWWEDAQ